MGAEDDTPVTFRGRRLGPAFAVREIVIAPGGERPYESGEWDDAIVVVEQGAVDIACVDGDRHRFVRGDIICLSRMALVALHNDQDVSAVLVAVTRRDAAGSPPASLDENPPDPPTTPASTDLPGNR